MQVVERIVQVRQATRPARLGGASIGFVPTMGALHAGHRSLIDAARAECRLVVVSIFVNPTQFAPQEDLSKYPRPREHDLSVCRAAGADLVFYPADEEMYPPGGVTTVDVAGLTTLWEGATRPTHFRGVTTVVAKLLNIVGADVAYFGQKDYQQQAIIRRMVRDLDMPTEIRTCPTIRDADGLALSSRNAYLSVAQRHAGLCLSRALQLGESLFQSHKSPLGIAAAMQTEIRQTPGVVLDYAAVVDPDSLQEVDELQPRLVALVAAKVGTTRLIDNAIWMER
ncbi:MAG: pantoate--beta-alanine ligase [Planctomycetaceae bacterium]|nr:pantoate--beta-alanine ligase [Planctomycetaceae bacterium]